MGVASGEKAAGATREKLLAEKARALELARQARADGRPDLADIHEARALAAGMEATNHPVRDTGKVDGLGRRILVDQFGRRHWRAEDAERPPGLEHLTADEWWRKRLHHGPTTCG